MPCNCNPNPEQAATQKALIRQYLEAGGTVSQRMAFDEFDCCRVSERIRELEKDGFPVDHVWETYTDGRTGRKVRHMTYRQATLPAVNAGQAQEDFTPLECQPCGKKSHPETSPATCPQCGLTYHFFGPGNWIAAGEERSC